LDKTVPNTVNNDTSDTSIVQRPVVPTQKVHYTLEPYTHDNSDWTPKFPLRTDEVLSICYDLFKIVSLFSNEK